MWTRGAGGSGLEGLAAALPCVPGSPLLAQSFPDPPGADAQWVRPLLLLAVFLVLRVGLHLTYPVVLCGCLLLALATASRPAGIGPAGARRKPKVK